MGFVTVECRKKDNLKNLERMSKFEEDWNGNGGRAFTDKAIKRFREIIENLSIQPVIAPTGRNSLYMEYRKTDGSILAFEVCENEIEFAECLIDFKTCTVSKIYSDFTNEVNKIVLDFYQKNCEYKLETPGEFTLCNYYHENTKINDRIYAHFPKCGDEPCPLLVGD